MFIKLNDINVIINSDNISSIERVSPDKTPDVEFCIKMNDNSAVYINEADYYTLIVGLNAVNNGIKPPVLG